MKNVLIACEESQTVCKEFRKLGINAFSCDIIECSGGHPEWHFKQDVLQVIKNKGGILETGEELYIDGKWDLMVAHPPCTYLAVSGARWFYHPEDKDLPIDKRRPHPKFPNRRKDQEDGIKFFLALANAPIDKIAVENPVGVMTKHFRKPDQIVQPYMFGDSAQPVVAIEELSELIKEITKCFRNKGNIDHLAEEVADVEIMVEQVKLIFNVQDKVEAARQIKLQRLENGYR